MPSYTPLKMYLYGLFFLITLGAGLANYFVFNPEQQTNNQNTTNPPHSQYSSSSFTILHENPLQNLLDILLILMLLISAISLRRLWPQKNNTPPHTSSKTQK